MNTLDYDFNADDEIDDFDCDSPSWEFKPTREKISRKRHPQDDQTYYDDWANSES